MARGKSKNSSSNNSANIGFEAKLCLAADKRRSNMDAAEYKHVVLGLIFLKYISDSFEEHHAKLVTGAGFVLLRFWFWLEPKPAGVIKVLGNWTPHSLVERLCARSTAHLCFQK